MNDNYEDYLIREMNEPQNPEGELDLTESPDWGKEEEEEKKEIGLRFENVSIWDGIPKLKWKDGGAFYDPKDE